MKKQLQSPRDNAAAPISDRLSIPAKKVRPAGGAFAAVDFPQNLDEGNDAAERKPTLAAT